MVPLVNARLLAWRIPRAQLVVLPGAGYLFLLDGAPRAAALVRNFFGAAVL